jgi:glycosyltransferase involved in cell wall biosynthesis
MEALSSGCRILTTALPGTREILGDTKSSMVDMVQLPPLETVDTPFEKDMPAMEQTLAAALERQIDRIQAQRQPDMAWAQKVTEEFTWEKVFSRIASVYDGVSRAKS